MNAFDRDTELERRQIHEISLNVARRLLAVLERRRDAPPAVAEEIVAGARVIADIQREVDGIMTALPHGETLDLAVLTHVLASHNRALSLVEDLEIRTGGRGAARHPDPERTHAALIATAREIEEEARRYERDPVPQMLRAPRPAAADGHPAQMAPRTGASGFPPPSQANRTAPPTGRGPARPPSRQPPPGAAPVTRTLPPAQPPHRQPAQQRLQPETALTQATGRRRMPLRALAFSPMSAVALVAGIAIVAASLAGAVSFALSNGDASQASATNVRAPSGKFDGRLSAGDAAPAAGGSDILVVAPPANAAPLAQPYLVVLATRPSTEELDQDFRYFKEAHPQLLGDARGRVDTMQSQDGKTWHRLSLIPPRSQEEAASLCAELKAAGLTECWIKPLPLGRDASR